MKKPLRRSKWTDRIAWSVWKIQQNNKMRSGGSSTTLCSTYPFSSADTDYHEFGTAFTGNLKVIAKCDDETGLSTEIIAGRQGDFVAGEWMQYETEAVALVGICDATFTGIIGNYYKDDVLIQVSMGEFKTNAVWLDQLTWG